MRLSIKKLGYLGTALMLTIPYHDFRAANKAAGFGDSSLPPKDYTWHHVEDGKPMMLVEWELHDAVRHTGVASLIKKGIVP